MAENSSPNQIVVEGDSEKRPEDPADVSAVFGTPYVMNGKTLIPVADVRRVTSGRTGSARWSRARPRAIIEVDGGRVRVVPVIEPLLIILPGIAAGAWNVYWILKTIRALKGKR